MDSDDRIQGIEGPGVTVVIPTFDRAEFLDESISSLLAQDYRDLEVLVLDDGSTDRTPEILKRYVKSHPGRFRWARHENMGQARTLNRGFEMAKNDIIGYLSSDDVLLPGAVAKLVEALVADPKVVAAYGGWDYVDEDGKKMASVMPEEFTLLHALRKSDPVIGPGSLFRRSAIDQVGGWDPEIRYSPDFQFWLRVRSVGPFRRVRQRLALYRWHEGMTGRSSPGLQIAQERVEVVDRVYASPNVSDELLEVKNEVYRSAFLAGASLVGGNAPWERFYVADRLIGRTFEGHELDLSERTATMRARIADVERELATVGERIAAFGDALARREIEIEKLRGEE